jgi:predicted TIM-barrel enzyme
MSDSQSDEDGVIGYQATTVTPAIMQPIAAAAFPSIRIFPAVSFIFSR